MTISSETGSFARGGRDGTSANMCPEDSVSEPTDQRRPRCKCTPKDEELEAISGRVVATRHRDNRKCTASVLIPRDSIAEIPRRLKKTRWRDLGLGNDKPATCVGFNCFVCTGACTAGGGGAGCSSISAGMSQQQSEI